ncbi:hypothetical protein [Nannocystis punicea]|uniref:Uncharacterized protein n=1 Tax=Nannocystis punicea TaxID=2995304 RepID=A0ABY7HBM9_9BACT|nr:hypothetical protein [Nannocystis poenicansa]WAS96515.1 hypothetical protein O0S08_10190 [Nannocystis poenicansa]
MSAVTWSGNRLGDLYIEEALLRGLDLSSWHRFGLTGLYLSHELYQHLVVAGTVGLLMTGALDRCHHEPAPERAQAAKVVIQASGDSRAPRPLCSVDAFMRFVRAPGLTVHCRRRGGEGPDRTFELEDLIEPGADPTELDALARRFADVTHLRPLARQADGILLSHQAARTASSARTVASIIFRRWATLDTTTR